MKKVLTLGLILANGLYAFAINPVLIALPHKTQAMSAYTLSLGNSIGHSYFYGDIFNSTVLIQSDLNGVSVSAVPIFTSGVKGSSLYQGAARFNIGSGVLSAGGRFYQAGEVTYRDIDGNDLGIIKPYCADFGLNYSLPVSEKIHLGVGLGYAYADLFQGQSNAAKVGGLDVDLGVVFLMSDDDQITVQWSDLGGLLKTSTESYGYQPSTFRLAYTRNIPVGNFESFAGIQIEKVLAPTAPILDAQGEVVSGKPLPSAFGALFQAWNDAPGGMAEEMQEIRPSLFYSLNLMNGLGINLGYSNQSYEKGRQNFIGIGVLYSKNAITANLGYAIPVGMSQAMSNHSIISLAYAF